MLRALAGRGAQVQNAPRSVHVLYFTCENHCKKWEQIICKAVSTVLLQNCSSCSFGFPEHWETTKEVMHSFEDEGFKSARASTIVLRGGNHSSLQLKVYH